MVEIRLPEISENVDSGDVIKLLVNVGDTVTVDQPLVELETDKAVFEVPSTTAGTVTELAVALGDTIQVGQVIARIEAQGAEAPAAQDSAAATVAEPDPKAPAPVSPEAGAAPSTPGGATTSEVEEALVAVADDTPESPPAAQGPVVRTGPAPASPTVRRLARELGLVIHTVPGSGPGGRISSEDVHRHAKALIQGAVAATAPGAPAARPLPDFARFGEIERVAMSKIRRVTAANMASAWNTVAAVTQNDEADITELEAARKRFGKLAEKAGGKLTMTAILLKVCASALKRFPEFNASLDTAKGEIVYKKYFHVGVAVDTERGLLVPVIRDVGAKNILTLSGELAEAAKKARDRKLMPADMEGANFTISNLGGIGGTGFSPIVNTPEVGILGVSRAKMQPVWQGDGFKPRLVMPLSLSYDHRLIDGALAARCLRWICEALEDPILLALDG